MRTEFAAETCAYLEGDVAGAEVVCLDGDGGGVQGAELVAGGVEVGRPGVPRDHRPAGAHADERHEGLGDRHPHLLPAMRTARLVNFLHFEGKEIPAVRAGTCCPMGSSNAQIWQSTGCSAEAKMLPLRVGFKHWEKLMEIRYK